MERKTIEEKAEKLEKFLMNEKIVSAGVGFDGVEFGWIVLGNGRKIYLEKVEVENIISE